MAEAVAVPVIASGGAGELHHLAEALDAGADAVLLASILHYGVVRQVGAQDSFDDAINTAHLARRQGFETIQETTLPAIKHYLLERSLPCRAHVTDGGDE